VEHIDWRWRCEDTRVVGCFRPTGKTHAVMTLGSQALHPTQASPAGQAFARNTGGLPSGFPVKLE
jgi:hypothetical protein